MDVRRQAMRFRRVPWWCRVIENARHQPLGTDAGRSSPQTSSWFPSLFDLPPRKTPRYEPGKAATASIRARTTTCRMFEPGLLSVVADDGPARRGPVHADNGAKSVDCATDELRPAFPPYRNNRVQTPENSPTMSPANSSASVQNSVFLARVPIREMRSLSQG